MEQVGIELQACSDHILHAAFVHIMEAWQVFDASTPELLSHLQILQSRTSVDEPRFTRLSSLIEEELSERGHLDQFLDRLTDLTSQAASEQCVVSGPGASQPVAKSVCAGSTDSSLSPTCSNTVDADAQNSESPLDIAASTSLAIASEASSASAAPPAAASHSAQHGPITNRADVDSNVVAAGPSVLEAAVAAYKQEKRQLWKARKAGAQAGWGFAKSHPSWPKPDPSASIALGPLRTIRQLSMKSSSLSSHQDSSALPEASSSHADNTAQPVQRRQHVQKYAAITRQALPQAANQSCTDQSPAALQADHKLLQLAAKPQAQSDVASADSRASLGEPDTSRAADLCSVMAELARHQECVEAQILGAGPASDCKSDNGRSHEVSSLERSVSQQSHQSGSNNWLLDEHDDVQRDAACSRLFSSAQTQPSVSELPQSAVGDQPTSTSACQHPAAEEAVPGPHQAWHKQPGSALASQATRLESHHLGAGQHDEEDDRSSQSGSEFQEDVHMQLCSVASTADDTLNNDEEHVIQQHLMRPRSAMSCTPSEGNSENEREDAKAAASQDGEQNQWVPAQAYSWQLIASMDGNQQPGPDGSTQYSEHASDSLQAGASAAAGATFRVSMPHRLSEWNMRHDDGLCSWPSTPLHDPVSSLSSAMYMPLAQNSKQRAKPGSMVPAVRKSWGSNDANQGDRFMRLPQGERLMLA